MDVCVRIWNELAMKDREICVCISTWIAIVAHSAPTHTATISNRLLNHTSPRAHFIYVETLGKQNRALCICVFYGNCLVSEARGVYTIWWSILGSCIYHIFKKWIMPLVCEFGSFTDVLLSMNSCISHVKLLVIRFMVSWPALSHHNNVSMSWTPTPSWASKKYSTDRMYPDTGAQSGSKW